MSSLPSVLQLRQQQERLMQQMLRITAPNTALTAPKAATTAAAAGSVSSRSTSVTSTAAAAAAADSKAEAVLGYIAKNRNKGTSDKYSSAWTMFERYLSKRNKAQTDIDEFDIADYLRERVEEHGVAASTMAGDRSAIADRLKNGPLKDVCNAKVVSDMMAVLRTVAAVSKPKQHMSAELMRELVLAHDARGPTGNEHEWLRERNLFLMFFMMHAFLRQSEAVAMLVEDVEVKLLMVAGAPQRVMHVFIAKSKTDQARMGHVVLLGAAADAAFCPIARLERYLRELRKAGFGGEKTPLFPTVSGAAMATTTPCGIVQKAVREANKLAQQNGWGEERWGDPDDYGSHSMRRGGVTRARANGASMLDIQKHGRWKSLTVFSYVGTTPEEQLAVTNSFLDTGAQQVQEPAAGAVVDEIPSVMAHALRAGGSGKKKGGSKRQKSQARSSAEQELEGESAAMAESDVDEESDAAKLREAEEEGMFNDTLSEDDSHANSAGAKRRAAAAASDAKRRKAGARPAATATPGGGQDKKKHRHR